MPRLVLDTNVLIEHGRRSVPQTILEARKSASELIQLERSIFILTPVYLEFIAGTLTRDELSRARAFLSCFRVADSGRITDEDWEQAKRIAQRIRAPGRKRQLGDCLIRAIADRLGCGIVTREKHFPSG